MTLDSLPDSRMRCGIGSRTSFPSVTVAVSSPPRMLSARVWTERKKSNRPVGVRPVVTMIDSRSGCCRSSRKNRVPTSERSTTWKASMTLLKPIKAVVVTSSTYRLRRKSLGQLI